MNETKMYCRHHNLLTFYFDNNWLSYIYMCVLLRDAIHVNSHPATISQNGGQVIDSQNSSPETHLIPKVITLNPISNSAEEGDINCNYRKQSLHDLLYLNQFVLL